MLLRVARPVFIANTRPPEFRLCVLCEQKRYKVAVPINECDFSDDVKLAFKDDVKLQKRIVVDVDAVEKKFDVACSSAQDEEEWEEPAGVDNGATVTFSDGSQAKKHELVLGDAALRLPLSAVTHTPEVVPLFRNERLHSRAKLASSPAVVISAQEQMAQAQKRLDDETAQNKATMAAAKAAAAAEAVVAKADKQKADKAVLAVAALARRECVEALFEQRTVFGDLPSPPLPAFDHTVGATTGLAIGNAVLIPAAKYKACALSDSQGREDFKGWVGKIIGYESGRKKMKVKVCGDPGFEHLPLCGSTYALSSLVRLT